MAISPQCDLAISPGCEGELRQFGAILLGPPVEDENSGVPVVSKRHVCVPCFDQVTASRERRVNDPDHTETFYEHDEPVEKAFDQGKDGLTAPRSRAHWHLVGWMSPTGGALLQESIFGESIPHTDGAPWTPVYAPLAGPEPKKTSADPSRAELVALCEAAIVPMGKWHDRDSATAHEQVGRAWALLRAGAPFTVCSEPPCATDNEMVWVYISWRGFDSFELGDDGSLRETFYIPTRQRITASAGRDWY